MIKMKADISLLFLEIIPNTAYIELIDSQKYFINKLTNPL